jgi:hypothetical protein
MSGTSQSSGLLAAGTNTVYTGKGTLTALTVITDGTNAATATVYDNTAGSGTVLVKVLVPGAAGAMHLPFPIHVRCDTGITIVLAGTGSGAVIHYGG